MSEGARGPYLTPNRALQLERSIARLDGRLSAELEQLRKELAGERQRSARLRAIVLHLLEDAKGTQ